MPSRKDSIDTIRRFNRHYVPAMRLLDRSYLGTGMSVLETAALLEIGENDGCSARDISRLFNMDKGYLSRTISRFVDEGLVQKGRLPEDARVQTLSLTQAGRVRVAELTEAGEEVVDEAFCGATDDQMADVAKVMTRILGILESGEEK